MALNIISNYAANVAHRNLTTSDMEASRSLSKLSSGKRVVSASDDSASMAIGARLNSEVASLKTATTNASQASSMLQIADGALSTIDNVLVRMKSLAVQASSENLSQTERQFVYDEFDALRSEIDRIALDTEFNGNKLLGGQTTYSASTVTNAIGASIGTANGIASISFETNAPNLSAGLGLTLAYDTATTTFTVFSSDGTSESVTGLTNPAAGTTSDVFFAEFGMTVSLNSSFDNTASALSTANTVSVAAATTATTLTYRIGSGGLSAQDELSFTLQQADAASLSANLDVGTTSSFATSVDAENAITYVGNAIDTLQSARANIGVGQNRLEFATQNLRSAQENNEAARSALLDLDVASEMTNFTSKQILVQAGVGMLSQANQMPQNLLRLLQ